MATYIDAAVEVLKRARGKPMTTREIVDAAISRGLLTPAGQTPERTMAATLYRQLSTTKLIGRECEPGRGRARRGSVRWMLSDAPARSKR